MKTFKEMIGLTGEEALEARVKNVVRNTSSSSRNKVEQFKQEFRDLQSKLFDHMDLAQKDANSLKVEMKEPTKWVNDLYDLAIKMAILAKKISICVNMHNNIFPDNKVEDLDPEDLELIKELNPDEE